MSRIPVDVTPCTARIARVRLGGTEQGAASYLAPRDWPEVPDTGEMSVSVGQERLTFARGGAARLVLALDRSRLQPHLLLRRQLVGE